MEKNKEKAVWFMVFLVVVVALEVITIYGVSWWLGKMFHVPPLPWWACCSIVFLGNVLEGKRQSNKKSDNQSDNGGKA